MKNIITRALAIAVLTTSISAFAAPGKSKAAKDTDTNQTNSDTTLVIYVVDEPNIKQDEAQPDKNNDKSEKQKLIEQQDNQWLHDLQGVYGG